MTTSSLTVLAIVSFFAATTLSFADTIAGRSGGEAFEDLETTDVISWTQTNAYTDVSISGVIGFGGSSSATSDLAGTAFLTTRIGPGTTSADEIARVSLFAQPNGFSLTTLFSGLTLGPGTYFVTTSFTPEQRGIAWILFSGNQDLATPGNSTNDSRYSFVPSGYPPASTFVTDPYTRTEFDFAVTGTAVPRIPATVTPEPATLSLLGTGLLGLSGLARRRHRR